MPGVIPHIYGKKDTRQIEKWDILLSVNERIKVKHERVCRNNKKINKSNKQIGYDTSWNYNGK